MYVSSAQRRHPTRVTDPNVLDADVFLGERPSTTTATAEADTLLYTYLHNVSLSYAINIQIH